MVPTQPAGNHGNHVKRGAEGRGPEPRPLAGFLCGTRREPPARERIASGRPPPAFCLPNNATARQSLGGEHVTQPGQWGARTEARPRGPAPWRSAACGMWTLRAAVRRGAWLSRWVRGRPVPRAAPPPPPPWSERALAAFGTGKAGGLQGRGGGGRGPRAHGGTSGAGEAEEEPEDAEEEEEEEELLRREPLLPSGTQRVCLVHPEIKGGPRKPTLTRGDPARAGAWPRGRGSRGRGSCGCNSGRDLKAGPHRAGLRGRGLGKWAGLRGLILRGGASGTGSPLGVRGGASGRGCQGLNS